MIMGMIVTSICNCFKFLTETFDFLKSSRNIFVYMMRRQIAESATMLVREHLHKSPYRILETNNEKNLEYL